MKTALAVGLSVLALGAAGAAVVAVTRVAGGEREEPARCPTVLVQLGPRCCAPGQVLTGTRCFGKPALCPFGMHVDELGRGCVVDPRRLHFPGGSFALSAEDWEAEGVVASRRVEVEPFSIDAAEVTYERWEHCVHAGACRGIEVAEPGVPVSNIDAKEAERYCRFEGGRLPSSEEWLFTAVGTDLRRFPWGSTGLVCRRAAFGLTAGPCASGGRAELAGSRPDGATPEGALDLSGNVAEWTTERDGRTAVRGGSYRSVSAVELKSWATTAVPARAPDVGFRCAYAADEP